MAQVDMNHTDEIELEELDRMKVRRMRWTWYAFIASCAMFAVLMLTAICAVTITYLGK